MTFKQFVTRFVFGYLLLLTLIGIFNRIVDPAWYYRDTEIKGFNAIKPTFINFARDVKPALLIRDQPEAIILGSSYSEIGFNPTNPFFTDHGRLKSMNFAFARASWGEVQCDFEFAVTHSNIKRALVGFQPGDLPISNCDKDFASIGRFNPLDLLITYSALDYSIETIRQQQTGVATHTREGMYFYNRWTDANYLFRKELETRVSNCQNNTDAKNASGLADSKHMLDLSGLQRMIATAKKHGVELVMFAYPEHAFLLELDNFCGGQEAEWQNMQQIAGFIDKESSGQARAWQFYGYNDVTAEPVRKQRGYWQDAKHFNFEVGDMMLEDMFDKSRGRLALARPLDSDYHDFLRERDEYLQLHPEFQVEMQNVYFLK